MILLLNDVTVCGDNSYLLLIPAAKAQNATLELDI
jgi:hypothetical protein